MEVQRFRIKTNDTSTMASSQQTLLFIGCSLSVFRSLSFSLSFFYIVKCIFLRWQQLQRVWGMTQTNIVIQWYSWALQRIFGVSFQSHNVNFGVVDPLPNQNSSIFDSNIKNLSHGNEEGRCQLKKCLHFSRKFTNFFCVYFKKNKIKRNICIEQVQ